MTITPAWVSPGYCEDRLNRLRDGGSTVSQLPASRAHPHPCSACSAQGTFCSLPNDLRAIFDKLKTTTVLAKGEIAFHEADPCHSVFAVCEGRMKLLTSSSEGRILLLRFTDPGEILGLTESLLGQTAYQCSAIAAEPSILARIPRDTFIRFVSSYPEACLRMTVTFSEQYKMAQRETKFLAFGGTSTARLARILLEQAAEHGEAVEDGIR